MDLKTTMTTTDLWTPPGARKTERYPPEFLKMIAVFADTAADTRIGLYCADCKQDFVGKNGRDDQQWIMECGCRTVIGGNPLKGPR